MSECRSHTPKTQKACLPPPVRPNHVIVLSGPTAVGKTALSLELARRLGGEIVSADSMQLYRGMDIGTAKIPPHLRRGVPHHLIDIFDIHTVCTVVDYVNEAYRAIDAICARGGVPIVVGGTGFYIHSLIYGPPEGPPASAAIRQKLEEEMLRVGPELMHQKLSEVDPEYAATIGRGDKQKIIRGLEIMALTQKKVSDFSAFRCKRAKNSYNFSCFFLNIPKNILYPRIEQRCDAMLDEGFPQEVERLVQCGLRRNLTAAQAIGYKQYIEYLDSDRSEADWERFLDAFKQASRRYAKRQFTWFRKEPLFTWLNLDELGMEGALNYIVDAVQ